MKKFICIFLFIFVIATVCSCSGNKNSGLSFNEFEKTISSGEWSFVKNNDGKSFEYSDNSSIGNAHYSGTASNGYVNSIVIEHSNIDTQKIKNHASLLEILTKNSMSMTRKDVAAANCFIDLSIVLELTGAINKNTPTKDAIELECEMFNGKIVNSNGWVIKTTLSVSGNVTITANYN